MLRVPRSLSIVLGFSILPETFVSRRTGGRAATSGQWSVVSKLPTAYCPLPTTSAVGESTFRDYIRRAGDDPAPMRRTDLTTDHLPARPSPALSIVPQPGAPLPIAGRLNKSEPQNLAHLSPEQRSAAILAVILEQLDDDKAEEVVTIDLCGKTDIADAMVVASGRSARHVGAMADKVVRRLKDQGVRRARMEGAPACDWVLIDADDVIVHLFRPEVRQFYNLERIWSETARAPVRPDA